MKMFSRLSVLTLLFLGIALMLVGGTTDVYAQATLQVTGDTGKDAVYNIGDRVEAIFTATDENGWGIEGVDLEITYVGLTDVAISNDGTTDELGEVTVTGTIAKAGVYIQAGSPAIGVRTRIDFTAEGAPLIITPAAIIITPPDPKFPLAVGDVFRQRIEIQDVTDLAGWQMDIAFNLEVLEVVDISEGDFLEQDGGETLFLSEQHPGKIAIRQVRVGEAGAPMSGVSGSGVLVVLQLRFLSSSEALLGLHNVRLSDSSGERLSYSVTLTPVVATHASAAAEDINQDGSVDILDLVAVAHSIGAARPHLRADVNDDGVIDVLDLVAIAGSPHFGRRVLVRAPKVDAHTVRVSDLMPATIREWIDLAQIKNDGSLRFQRGLATLESLLAVSLPSETRLLLNYPNPFNPETWIPYQLSEPANVSVSIYSVNGHLVRRLDLGHQAAGVYRSRGRAAYWDGRNEFGERVASGLYFYTLTAGNFTATRKMLIRK